MSEPLVVAVPYAYEDIGPLPPPARCRRCGKSTALRVTRDGEYECVDFCFPIQDISDPEPWWEHDYITRVTGRRSARAERTVQRRVHRGSGS
jgi:hypothetical protein